jgi:hypothetical protein
MNPINITGLIRMLERGLRFRRIGRVPDPSRSRGGDSIGEFGMALFGISN